MRMKVVKSNSSVLEVADIIRKNIIAINRDALGCFESSRGQIVFKSFIMFVSLTTLLVVTAASANEIAFSFDDAPRGDEAIFTGRQRADKLIEVLLKHKIQAVFFVNPERFRYDDRKDRIIQYAKAGHLIANHTYSHPDIKKIKVENYFDEISLADELLQEFPTYTKWFRFPYLREGETTEVRDQIRSHLRRSGYINGYVTVDNYDYFINDLVQAAISSGHKVNLNRACRMLADLMWDGIQFYDEVAKRHIGKVKHVLLMHENDIEALCLDKLIDKLKRSGWRIIPPAEAYTDTRLAIEPNTLYLSQGRVAAIAHAKSGKQYKSKWESTTALINEFKRRKIVTPVSGAPIK